MSFIKASALGPLTASNTATIVDPATPAGGNATLNPLVSFNPVSASGSNPITFSGIPSWAKRITVMFNGVSTNGTSQYQIQLGTGSTPTYTTSGYAGSVGNRGTETYESSGFLLAQAPVAAAAAAALAFLLVIQHPLLYVTSEPRP